MILLRMAVAAGMSMCALIAAAQSVQRPFPATALRGQLAFGQPPLAELNGEPVRLAPGARIRGENNLLQMSGALAGQKFVVNYTRDEFGLLKDVWLLTPEERARAPWPRTAREAAEWQFDASAQAWRKP